MKDLRLHEGVEYHTYDQMIKMQERQLKKHLTYCIENSPYYHKLLSDNKIAKTIL